jgi:hypothetical protein
MSYSPVGQQYNISYATNRASGYMLGNTVVAPVGSNLPVPAPVGRYGATSFSNSNALSKTTSKQFPVRYGQNAGWVTFVSLTEFGGAGSPMPAYGN